MPRSVTMTSFTTRPDRGGEGGVGWEFIRAGAVVAAQGGWTVNAIIDARDVESVMGALDAEDLLENINVWPVAVPSHVLARVGDRRTRLSYIAWWGGAQRVLKVAASQGLASIFHQVTFATASLPPLTVPIGAHGVWGPLMIPQALIGLPTSRQRLLETTRSHAAKKLASRLVRALASIS